MLKTTFGAENSDRLESGWSTLRTGRCAPSVVEMALSMVLAGGEPSVPRDGTFHGACWKWTLCPTDGNFTQLNSSSNISEQNTSAIATLQYWSSPQKVVPLLFHSKPGESLDPKTKPCATADETSIWIWKTKCFVPEQKESFCWIRYQHDKYLQSVEVDPRPTLSSHCCDSFCINFLLTLRPLCMSSSSLEIFQRRCCSCRDLEF